MEVESCFGIVKYIASACAWSLCLHIYTYILIIITGVVYNPVVEPEVTTLIDTPLVVKPHQAVVVEDATTPTSEYSYSYELSEMMEGEKKIFFTSLHMV